MRLILFILRAILIIWRIKIMSRNAMNMAKGIGIGVLTGATALVVGSAVMQSKNHSSKNSKNMKSMKRTAGRAVHTVNEILGGMEDMLK